MTITTNYSGIGAIYFNRIIDQIIKIAKLDEGQKTILDYGCGEKVLSTKLKNSKVFNYDINPVYSEINSINNIKFDYIVLNHVLMYLSKKEIKELFDKIKMMNKRCEFIIGIGRQNFFSKIAKTITLNFKAHDETVSSYLDQYNLINDNMKIINYKKNIYFMTDIFHTTLS